MGTVSFSGKAGATAKAKPEQKQKSESKQKSEPNQKSKINYSKLVGDQSWYQSYCNRCPYLITADVLDMFVCGCPAGKECLAKGILVAESIIADRYNEFRKQMLEENKVRPPIKHKKIKTRRGVVK